jgi:hypothetical protein
MTYGLQRICTARNAIHHVFGIALQSRVCVGAQCYLFSGKRLAEIRVRLAYGFSDLVLGNAGGRHLPPCVKKVAQGSRCHRKLLLGHELMRWTPAPLFWEMWRRGPWRRGQRFHFGVHLCSEHRYRNTKYGAATPAFACRARLPVPPGSFERALLLTSRSSRAGLAKTPSGGETPARSSTRRNCSASARAG